MASQVNPLDHGGMHRTDAAHDSPLDTPPEAAPDALLAEVVARGLPGLGVPRALGGQGATPAELAHALSALARRHPAAAWLAWSQCMAAEALVHSPNVALREHLLPDVLDGTRAGALSWRMGLDPVGAPPPVTAQLLDRGWHLHGRLEAVPNLQWEGYAVVCPVCFRGDGAQPARQAWVLLRSEEDGLRHEVDRGHALARQAASGTLHLRRVHFREDELLADDASDLGWRLRLLDQALRPAVFPADQKVSHVRIPTHHPHPAGAAAARR